MGKITLDNELLFHKRINREVVDKIFIEEFGEEYVEYRNLWKKSGLDYLPEFPIHLDIEVIDACNYRCKYCWRNEKNNFINNIKINTRVKFPLKKYEEIIKEGKKYNLKAINLGFSGECLLNKDISKYVKIARDNGLIDIRIITNGSLLKKELIYDLYESGLTFLSVSVDACDPVTYKKMKGVNNFHKIKENIILLYKIRKELKLKLPLLRATLFRAPDNVNERNDFIKVFSEYVDFIDLQSFTNNSENENLDLDPYCFMPFRRLSIFANGDVAPCCKFYSRQLVFANVNDDSIFNIWHSSKIERIREAFRKKEPLPICIKCLKSINV